MNRTTRIAHLASVAVMGLFVLVVTLDGFVQSYAGLHDWAKEQGLKGWKANSFPLLVDLFVMIGELGLFTLALEGHRLTRRGLSWVDAALPFGLASAGWGVSLAFNVGAVNGWEKQVTAAVAPIASMLGLLVLLRTVHRLITRIPQGTSQVPARLVDKPRMNGATVATPVDQEPVPDMQVPLPVNGFPVLASVAEPSDLQMRAAREFADDITAGRVPGIKPIKQQLKVGQPKAREIRTYLATLAKQ